jgi:glucosamine kinase
LRAALRAVDGFMPMTPMLSALIDEMGGADGVVAFSLRARPVDFAELAPRLLDSTDAAAQAVMAQAMQDVAEAITVLQQGGSLPVVFLGGLGPHFAGRLQGRWDIRPAQGSALDGALMLAREAA